MAGNNGFVAGIGNTNVDILYSGLSRLPEKGEELYCEEFSLQLGGGVPATMIGLGRLGLRAKIATELGTDLFSLFAKEQQLHNSYESVKNSSIELFLPNTQDLRGF